MSAQTPPTERAVPKAAIVLLLLACSRTEAPQQSASREGPRKPPPAAPSAVAAKELIANSPEWSEYEFTNAAYTLPLKRSAMNEPAQKAAKELAAAGWIRLSGEEVVLSSRAETDKRFLVRPNGVVDLVPIARKELIEVANVRLSSDGNASADLTWRWLPNEVGKAFQSGMVKARFDAMHHATATLIQDGSAWIVLRITSAASPSSSEPR